MAASDELAAALKNLGQSIGNASDDLRSSTQTSTRAVNNVKDAIKGFSNTVKNTASALSTSAEGSFASYDKAVLSATQGIRSLTRGYGRVSTTVSVLTKGFDALFKAATEYSDKLIGLYDGLSEFGVTVGYTTDQLLKLTHTAGYTLESSKEFSKLLGDTNESLTALGPTTYAATKRLANVFATYNVGNTQEEFLKLGLGPKQLNKFQAEYIKQQAMAGIRLTANDDELRESTLQYARTLTKLSMITGESRDKLAQEIAEGRRDVRYNVRIQELIASGNKAAADAFDQASAIIGTMIGKDHASAVREFVAGGVATTKQGEALLFKTQGQIVNWVKAVEENRMSPEELARRVAKAENNFVDLTKVPLSVSEEFANSMFTSGETVSGALKLAGIESKEEFDKMMQMNKARGDELKSAQDLQLRTERITGQTYDKLRQMMAGPAQAIILGLVNITMQLARGAAKLALLLPIEDKKIKESLQNIDKILASSIDVGEAKNKVETQLQEIDSELAKRDQINKKREQALKELQEAEQRQPKLEQEAKEKPGTDVLDEMAKNNKITIERKKREIEQLKQQEKQLEEKRTRKQLEQDKARLLKEKEQLEKRKKETTITPPKPKPPTTTGKPEEARTADVAGLEKYLSADMARLAKVNPTLQKRIGDLATKYYSLTGRKLVITSSYRTEEEQLELYNAWRAAGGRYPREGGPAGVQTKFGWLYMPSKTPGQHGAGIAVDINQNQLDFIDSRGLLEEFGLKRHHPIKQDPVHVTLKGKRGNVFQGPDSGYSVELHGTEAVLPINGKPVPVKITSKIKSIKDRMQFSEKMIDPVKNFAGDFMSQISDDYRLQAQNLGMQVNDIIDPLTVNINDIQKKNIKASEQLVNAANDFASDMMSKRTSKVDLNSQNFTKNFDELTQSIKAKVYDFKQNMDKNEPETLDKSLTESAFYKLDSMISSVERSNSIYNDLKMYMRN